MRGGYFFKCTLELLLLLFCLTLDNLEAKPNKHYGRCKFENDNNAYCRPQDACTTFGEGERNDEQFLNQHNCGEVDGKPLVCCPETSKLEILIDEVFQMTYEEVKLPLAPHCGQMLKDRIFNGNVTGPDEYPWMALIQITKADGVSSFVCGGVLITNRWVLTAAHCHNERDGRISGIRLGEWDTKTDRDCIHDRYNREECLLPHVDVPVDLVKIHPAYDKITYLDDIALLRLAYPVSLSKNIKTICLPHTPKLVRDNFENDVADICGWGRTETEQVSTLKLKATLNIWQHERCRSGLEKLNVRLDERLLCASGAANVSSCYGDSGGPLMLEDTSYYVIGVISRGVNGCKRSDTPIVFTRVATYIDWIKETLSREQ